MRYGLAALLSMGCTIGGFPDVNSDTGSDIPIVDTGPFDCFEGNPSVTIGTGEYAWEDLHSGDAVTIVHGPQGGWHILGSIRVNHMSSLVTVRYTVHVADTQEVVSDNELRVALIMESECSGYYPGMYGYLDVDSIASGDLDTPPELLAGLDLVMTCEVEDSDGRIGAATMSVIGELDPADAEASTDTGSSE